jgi:peptide/nickel transport system substrate-binding protein
VTGGVVVTGGVAAGGGVVGVVGGVAGEPQDRLTLLLMREPPAASIGTAASVVRDPALSHPAGGSISYLIHVTAVACCASVRVAVRVLVCLVVLAMDGSCGVAAPPADVVRVAVAAAPDSLDPRLASSATGARLAQLLAPALCVVDDTLQPRLLLAERIAVADDGLTVDVTMRSGVPVDDVVATWREVLDPAFGSHHRSRLDMVADVRAVDDRTVRFRLLRPHAPFVVEGLCGVGIVGPGCRADSDRCRRFPDGHGAFVRVDDGAVDDRLRLQRRDGAGPDLEVQVVRDGGARLLGLMAGRSDVVIGDLAPWDLGALRDAGLQVQTRPGVGFSYLGLHAGHGALVDDRVRRAIALAVDVPALFEGRLKGQGSLASGLLPAGHPLKDPRLQPLAHDDTAARTLLREAGVVEGTRLRLLVSTDRLRRSLALAIAEQLRAIGFVVDVEIRDWSVVYDALKAGRFDLVLARWTPVVEADLLTTVAHSKSIPTATQPGGNRGAFVDADVDRWLDEARVSTDVAVRADRYARVEARLLQRVPFVPLWHEHEVLVSSSRVVDVYGAPLSPWRTGSFLPLLDARLREGP